MKQRMGGSFDWGNVSEGDMQNLAEQMFDAAKVPAAVRSEYWRQYDSFRISLEGR